MNPEEKIGAVELSGKISMIRTRLAIWADGKRDLDFEKRINRSP